MYLFFDTETADAPSNDKTLQPRDYEAFPRLVQLAYAIYDENRKLIKEFDKIIKPNGKFKITEGAFDVHGIDTERAEKEGMDVAEVVNEFYEDLNKYNYIICHNVKFDSDIILAEHYRNKLKFKSINKNKTLICTMKLTTRYCQVYNIQNHGGMTIKWPSLSELHGRLFGYAFEGAHNALIDVRVTTACFWKLQDKKIINIGSHNVHDDDKDMSRFDINGIVKKKKETIYYKP